MGNKRNRVIRQSATVDGDSTVVIQSGGSSTGNVIGSGNTVIGVGQVRGQRGVSVTQADDGTYVNGRKVSDETGSLQIINGQVYLNGKRIR